jgi:hypothetical protein
MRERDLIDAAIGEMVRLLPDAEVLVEGRHGESDSHSPHLSVSLRVGDQVIELLGKAYAGESSAGLHGVILQLKSDLASAGDAFGFVIAPYLSRERQMLIRAQELGYLDLSGNVRLWRGPLMVHVESAGNPHSRESGVRQAFSGKGSLVPEILLEQPRIWGVRELARAVGLDPGHVSRVAADLAEARYISRDKQGLRILRPEELLADWAEAYRPPKSRDLQYFSQAPRAAELIEALERAEGGLDIAYALAYQAGASLVSAHASVDRIDVYAADEDAVHWLESVLSARPVDQGANLVIHVLANKDDATIRRRRDIGGLWVVSDVRLYLDLSRYPRRGQEQGEHLLERMLRPRWRQNGVA